MSLATNFIENILKNPKEKSELLKIFSDYFDNSDNNNYNHHHHYYDYCLS